MLLMMSISICSLSGRTLFLNNNYTDTILNSDTTVTTLPIKNIRNANSIYFFQVRQLNLYRSITLLQEEQIQNYSLALINSELEAESYKGAYEVCLQIVDEKDAIIKLRNRERIILGTIILGLTSYIIFY